MVVTPSQTSTYTLTCTGPFGTSSVGATVVVGTIAVTKVGHVSGSTAYYGTFGSWDQHVVSNSGGIFVAYLSEDDNFHSPAYWTLSRSTDGGKTFTTIYDGRGDGPVMIAPAIETDAAGNVYVVVPTAQSGSFMTGPTLFYKFSPSNAYGTPQLTRLPIGGAGKFSTVYDPARNLIDVLYWMFGAGQPNFFSISPAGAVVKRVQLFSDREPHAQPEYPNLTIASDGTIFAGWSTVDAGLWNNGSGVQNYYDSHFLATSDGGTTWTGPSGQVTLPIAGDDTGPSFQIVNTADPAQFQPMGSPGYSGNWNVLMGFAYNGGYLHFFYGGGELPAAHNAYARLNWSTKKFDLRQAPYFHSVEGIAFDNGGGAFTESGNETGRLYFAGAYFDHGAQRVGVIASDDEGQTWYQVARTDNFVGAAGYVNTSRFLASDGSVQGSFTVAGPSGGADVYYFRATPSAPASTGSTYASTPSFIRYARDATITAPRSSPARHVLRKAKVARHARHRLRRRSRIALR